MKAGPGSNAMNAEKIAKQWWKSVKNQTMKAEPRNFALNALRKPLQSSAPEARQDSARRRRRALRRSIKDLRHGDFLVYDGRAFPVDEPDWVMGQFRFLI